jgi:hypothetical protein
MLTSPNRCGWQLIGALLGLLRRYLAECSGTPEAAQIHHHFILDGGVQQQLLSSWAALAMTDIQARME